MSHRTQTPQTAPIPLPLYSGVGRRTRGEHTRHARTSNMARACMQRWLDPIELQSLMHRPQTSLKLHDRPHLGAAAHVSETARAKPTAFESMWTPFLARDPGYGYRWQGRADHGRYSGIKAEVSCEVTVGKLQDLVVLYLGQLLIISRLLQPSGCYSIVFSSRGKCIAYSVFLYRSDPNSSGPPKLDPSAERQ